MSWWRFRDLNPGPADYDSGQADRLGQSKTPKHNGSALYPVSDYFGHFPVVLVFWPWVPHQCPAANTQRRSAATSRACRLR